MGLFDDEDEDDLFGGGRAGTKFSSGAPRAAAAPPKGCLISIGHFPQKSPIIRGSFAKRDVQLKASYVCAACSSSTTVKCHPRENSQISARY